MLVSFSARGGEQLYVFHHGIVLVAVLVFYQIRFLREAVSSPQVVVGLAVAGMAVGDYHAGGGNTDAIRLSAVICQVTNIQLTDGIQTVRGVFALVIVLLIGAGFAGFLLLITYSWRQIVAYDRTGHMHGSEAEEAGT